MSRQRARASAIAIAALLGACTRWETMLTPVAPTELPSSVKVWSTDGARTLLSSPYVRQDTLYGRSKKDTVRFALARIDRVARPRLDGAKSAGAFLGGVAVWAGIALVTMRD